MTTLDPPRTAAPFTALSVHPDTLPIVLETLGRHDVPITPLSDSVAGHRRLLAGKPGGSSSVVAATEAPTLSNRELQVLRAMATGKSNKRIGAELYLSEDTVKTHARRLFRKLHVRDRAHAVYVGCRLKLIPM